MSESLVSEMWLNMFITPWQLIGWELQAHVNNHLVLDSGFHRSKFVLSDGPEFFQVLENTRSSRPPKVYSNLGWLHLCCMARLRSTRFGAHPTNSVKNFAFVHLSNFRWQPWRETASFGWRFLGQWPNWATSKNVVLRVKFVLGNVTGWRFGDNY